MCGIIGYVARARHAGFERSLRLLSHRGPDGEGETAGVCNGQPYWVGHRRLSIIDIQGGAQPLQKSGLVITFNGEIYNYLELAAKLTRDRGVSFRTRSDTEVLLEAYRAWGEACLELFNGMWAFAILDIKRGVMFCARDRMGKKPFYYSTSREGFFFASEPPPLLPRLSRIRADNTALVSYLLGAQPDAASSFFDGIRQLAPGHCMTVSVDTFEAQPRRYWSARQSAVTPNLNYEAASEQLTALFSDAVSLRLRSDVGFAVATSGGLDSTIVLAAAAEQSRKPVKTVSVTFDQTFEWDETEFIERLNEHYAVIPTYVRASAHITLAEMLDDVTRMVSALSEPTPYTSVPYVSKLYEATASAGIKVLLEGQGADELFGGYPYFRAHQRFALGRRWANPRDYLLAIRQRSSSARTLYYRLNTFRPFLTDAARKLVRLPELTPTIHDALIDAQENAVLPGLLQYSDRLAMRFGVEVRLPFLDYRLVEFVNSLPDAFKVRKRVTKRILRTVYGRTLPAAIVERPKVGFGSPTTMIIREHSDRLTSEFVKDGMFANSTLFRTGWRRALRGGFMRTLPNMERVLWRFIVIDKWMKQFGVEIAN